MALVDLIEIEAGDTIWRFDRSFLMSNWTCIWGRGCKGILATPSERLGQGCCSIGADLGDIDESLNLSANAATLRPEQFEHHADALNGGIYSDATRLHTRIVDGACIFLNRPDFVGGAGCALHVAALAWNESPIDWKPSVCWQLPVHVDWVQRDEHTEIATVRGWTREDWGEDGTTMAWCCTEEPEAYSGDRPVVESLAAELTAMVSEPVYVELRRRIANA